MKYVDKPWYAQALYLIKKYIEAKNFSVYDIGAGNSVLEDQIQKLGGKWYGFDYNPRTENIRKLNIENELDPDAITERPDFVLFLEVIEHLLNPGMAVANLAKITPKGSYLFLSTPNPFWSAIRLKFFLQNKFPMFEKSDMDNNHHVFTAWPHVVEKLLIDNGFEVIERMTMASRAKFPQPEFNISYPARIMVRLLRRIMEFQSPISKGMSYGILAIKK